MPNTKTKPKRRRKKKTKPKTKPADEYIFNEEEEEFIQKISDKMKEKLFDNDITQDYYDFVHHILSNPSHLAIFNLAHRYYKEDKIEGSNNYLKTEYNFYKLNKETGQYEKKPETITELL